MNLVTRFLAARRDKLLMRLGCWLVCFSLVLGLMFPQQRAHALVAELSMTAVASVAAAYLGACGLSFITQGMDKDALVSAVQRLIQEFLDTELGGKSIQDWLGNVWDLAVIAGKLIMGRPLTDELVTFAQWVAGKYGIQAGENVVYSESGTYVTLANGSKFYLCTGFNTSAYKFLNAGTPITQADFPVVFATGYSVDVRYIDGADCIFYLNPQGEEIHRHIAAFDVSYYWPMYVGVADSSVCFVWPSLRLQALFATLSLSQFDIGIPVSIDESLSVDRDEDLVYVPPGIAAEQGIALDVGAAATMDLDLVLQGVLEDVLAGTLTSTMEVAGEAVVNPPAGEITDVDNLGLPALGQALTSRFPFSIPWDFFRAVQLLAAPAKAPQFEVDFMQPIEHRVGQWQGDTKVVLDFSEYAIIGQISRWTSTTGFCLMLAGATKRLIWTA